MEQVFTPAAKRPTIAEHSQSRASWKSRIARIWQAMGGINIGNGSFSLGNIIALLAVAAMVWFGSTVTSDHDQINRMPGTLQNIQTSVDSIKTDIANLSTITVGLQRDGAEDRARLDCIQGVGTVAACDRPRPHR